MLTILGIPDSDFPNYKISEEYSYRSRNPHNDDDGGMNEVYANFEYLIDSSNQKKWPFGLIYDQQIKRFSESLNVVYGSVLNNTKNESLSLSCSFHYNILKDKPGFIVSTNELQEKALVFVYEKSLLNINDKRSVVSGEFEKFRVFRICRDENYKCHPQEVSISEKIFSTTISVQSIDDGGAGPHFEHLIEGL
jgi:hypothetical protein